ncbi:MAG: hypothetical protein AAFV07_04745 [Bacteroidota bacterium]
MEFESLQKKWQELGPKTGQENLQDSQEKLMGPIQKLQRRIVFSCLTVSILFAPMFVGMGAMYRNFGGEFWAFDLGITLIFLDMILALFFAWSTVITWRNKYLNLNNRDFMRKVKRSIIRRRQIKNRFMPIYLLLMVTGIHLVYLHMLRPVPLPTRIMMHVAMTLLVLIMYVVSYYFVAQKRKREEYPLLAKIEAWEKGLEDGSQIESGE